MHVCHNVGRKPRRLLNSWKPWLQTYVSLFWTPLLQSPIKKKRGGGANSTFNNNIISWSVIWCYNHGFKSSMYNMKIKLSVSFSVLKGISHECGLRKISFMVIWYSYCWSSRKWQRRCKMQSGKLWSTALWTRLLIGSLKGVCKHRVNIWNFQYYGLGSHWFFFFFLQKIAKVYWTPWKAYWLEIHLYTTKSWST